MATPHIINGNKLCSKCKNNTPSFIQSNPTIINYYQIQIIKANQHNSSYSDLADYATNLIDLNNKLIIHIIKLINREAQTSLQRPIERTNLRST